MPNDPNQSPIESSWVKFATSVQGLLVVQVDDRPLDQYLVFRDTVLGLVQSEQFLRELNDKWIPFNDTPRIEIGKALILELQTYHLAAEVAKATEKPEDAKAGWKKMLGRAKTVSGSVKDLIDDLPPYAKGALTLFGELIDLFKGKD